MTPSFRRPRLPLALLLCGTAWLVACGPPDAPFAEAPFWAHRFVVVPDIPYGGEPLQKLDLYLQGELIGEPDWFRPAAEPRPTLVYVHGGGWVEGDKASRIGYLVHFLERGWNVVNVNYRIGAGTAPQAVDDVMCAVRWVAEQAAGSGFDTDRIVLGGESAGGHLALLAAFLNTVPGSHECYVGEKLNVRAVVNWFGVTDLARLDRYLKEENPGESYLLEWIGDEERLAAVAEKYSPIRYVSDKVPAVLTIHGEVDTIVPLEQATLLHEALQRSGVENQLLTLAGGSHQGFADEQWRQAFATIFRFLEEQEIDGSS